MLLIFSQAMTFSESPTTTPYFWWDAFLPKKNTKWKTGGDKYFSKLARIFSTLALAKKILHHNFHIKKREIRKIPLFNNRDTFLCTKGQLPF